MSTTMPPTADTGRGAALRARLAPLSELRRRAAIAWQRLSPREQHLVLLATTVVGLVLVWQLLLLPALETTRTLSRALPALRADAARLDAIITQTQALQRQAGVPGTPEASDIAASLARAGLDAHASVTPQGSDWLVQLTQAPVGAVMLWLDDSTAALRLQARAVSLARVSDTQGAVLPGVVSGQVLLGTLEAGAQP